MAGLNEKDRAVPSHLPSEDQQTRPEVFMHRCCVTALLATLTTSACVWQGEAPAITGVDLRLTLLHTTDIHSRLFPFELAPTASDESLGLVAGNAPFGGAARLAYLVKRERARADRVLHVDTGDPFQGAPVFNFATGEPELRFLALVGVDAVVVGNHEFDNGPYSYVAELERWGNWDNLAANYRFSDPDDANHHALARLAQPFALYNLDGLKVAVIGMANLGSLSSIGEGGNSLQITPLEQNQVVQTYVDLLHSSVDLIVVASHLGLTEDEDLIQGYDKVVWRDRMPDSWSVREDLGDGRVVAFVPGVRDVDLILGGHLHVVLNPPKLVTDVDGREVIIAHSGAFAKYLGRLDLILADDAERGGKRVLSHKYQVFPVDQRLAPYEDPAVSRMLEQTLYGLHRNLDLKRVIAYAPRTITRRAAGGSGDSELGNLVSRAMRFRRRVEAEFAITNTLGIRDNFYRGPITLEDLFNVFPFENTLTVMYLSGSEIQELVNFVTERSASRGCQAQAQTSGLNFTMNCGQVLANERDPSAFQDPGEEITVGDAPHAKGLSPTGTYKVATNDYIANGGSGFRVLKRNTTKFNTGVPLRSALIDYLATLPPCGVLDLAGPRYCLSDDPFSRATCTDLVDCEQYVDACDAGEIPRLPRACLPAERAEACLCPAQPDPGYAVRACGARPEVRGPYSNAPCVVATTDGHIKRKVVEGLDQLPDPPEPTPY